MLPMIELKVMNTKSSEQIQRLKPNLGEEHDNQIFLNNGEMLLIPAGVDFRHHSDDRSTGGPATSLTAMVSIPFPKGDLKSSSIQRRNMMNWFYENPHNSTQRS